MDSADFWKMQESIDAEKDDDTSKGEDVGALALKYIREAQAISLDLRRTLERGTDAIQRLRESAAPAQSAKFEANQDQARTNQENTEAAGNSPLQSTRIDSPVRNKPQGFTAAEHTASTDSSSKETGDSLTEVTVHKDEKANENGQRGKPMLSTISSRESQEASQIQTLKPRIAGVRSPKSATPEKQKSPLHTHSSPRRSPRLQQRAGGRSLASSTPAAAPQTPRKPRTNVQLSPYKLNLSRMPMSPDGYDSSSSIPSPVLYVPRNVKKFSPRRGKRLQSRLPKSELSAGVADSTANTHAQAQTSPLKIVTTSNSSAKGDSSKAEHGSDEVTVSAGTESQPIKIQGNNGSFDDTSPKAQKRRIQARQTKERSLARSQTASVAETRASSATGSTRLKRRSTTSMMEEDEPADEVSTSESAAKRRKLSPKKRATKAKPQKNPDTGRVPNLKAPKIFQGLTFLFLPIGGRSISRMTELQNVLDRGAEVVHYWELGPTHVISPVRIGEYALWSYKDVTRDLGTKYLPRHVSIVNYDFYYDSFRKGRRMMEKDYPVPGHLEALEERAREEEANRKETTIQMSNDVEFDPTEECDEQYEQDQLPIEIPDSQSSFPQQPTEATGLESPAGQSSSRANPIESGRTQTPTTETEKPFKLYPKAVPIPWIVPDQPLTRADLRSLAYQKRQSRVRRIPDNDSDDKETTPSSEGQLNSLDEVIRETKDSFEQDDTNLIDFSTFACMQPRMSGGAESSPNALLIEKLEEMLALREQQNDQWRTMAYRKALSTIRRLPEQITSEEQARRIPNIGESLAQKIGEILDSGDLAWLQYARNDEDSKVLQDFVRVYDVGRVQAGKWIKAGFRTLDDLRTKAKLTVNQQIGLDHYRDFQSRIGRPEVKCHKDLVQAALGKVSDQLEITIMGSFRRGADTCGDIDLLITPKEDNISKDSLYELVYDQLIPRLKAQNYIQATLSEPSSGGPKWMGAAIVPGKFGETWRRVDFLTVPYEQRGAAFIYFTGDDIFNRSIRLLASKKGMRLNEKGLYKDVLRGPNRENLNVGTLVEGRDERKIFEALEVPYKEPWERNVR